jgi:hypothetical protein
MDEDMPEIPDSVSRVLAEASKNWTLQVTSITKQMSSAISAATIARDVAKRMQPFQDAIRIHSVINTQATIARGIAESMQPFYDAIQRSISSIDFSWVHEALQRMLPPNWRDLEWCDVDRALEVMDETGWCLVWCPRVGVVKELIREGDLAARTRMILDAKAAVVEDMDECLAGMKHSESQEYRQAATKALRAFDDGHVEAAQALAAAVISAVINGGFRLPSFGEARTRFQGDPKEASIRAFREQAVFNMVARSLQAYYAHRGDPVPPSFSRHATAHSVSDEQYNEVNALAALLLAVAFTKEADLLMQWSDEQQTDAASDGEGHPRPVSSKRQGAHR